MSGIKRFLSRKDKRSSGDQQKKVSSMGVTDDGQNCLARLAYADFVTWHSAVSRHRR